MKKCAFLTLDERGDYVIDDEHAIGPLEQLTSRLLIQRSGLSLGTARDDQ